MSFDPFTPSPIAGLPDKSWLTTRQLAAIGSVLAVWSWIDVETQNLLCRLIKTDSMLAQSLTEDLGPDNRIKALKRLLKTWDHAIYDKNEFRKASLDEALAITKWIERNKSLRNQIAHWVWLRSDDETLFGWKHHTMPFLTEDQRPNIERKVTEIEEFAQESGKIVVRMNAAYHSFGNLPDWP